MNIPFKTCSIAGCAGNASSSRKHGLRGAMGYCPVHYQKYRKYGDPLAGKPERHGCLVYGCLESHKSRGYCASHAERVRKYGDPMPDKPLKTTGAPMAYFLAAVSIQTDECVIWPFARSDMGYGQVASGGKLLYVHREMCRLVRGDAPTAEHQAAHSCGRGADGCFNHRHLRWATGSENQMDRVAHKTSNRGIRNGQAKLGVADVIHIRAMAGSMSDSEIGKKFSVSGATVRGIRRRESWAWLE